MRAAMQLNEVIRHLRVDQMSFKFPELDGLAEGEDSLRLSEQIHKTLNSLDSRKAIIKNRRDWSKYRHTIERLFAAMSPFAKTFLSISSQGSSVSRPWPWLANFC